MFERIQEHVNHVKVEHIRLGNAAEEKNLKYIEELYQEKRLSFKEKDYLIKFNRMLAR